jgi:hypothetical protein
VSIFDSGFRIAGLLRYEWFRKILEEAGWRNGGRIIGCTFDTSVEELYGCLKNVEAGEEVLVVLSGWARSFDGNLSASNAFQCMMVKRTG